MGFLSAIFGAKPPYGTPPFAPPHPNTGGAEVPTTADNADRPRGLSGFFDRLANPTNGLGQIGMALLAGSGGPLGGMAQVLMAQSEARRKATAPQLEHVGDSLGVVDPTTGQFTPTYTAPHSPTGFAAELQAAGIDPASEEGKAKLLQHANNSLDPWVTMMTPTGSYAGPRSAMPGALGAAPTTNAPAKFKPGEVVDGYQFMGGDDADQGNWKPVSDSAAPASYDGFKRAIIGQESGGRYGVANTEGSGAMGIGQVMPDTARVLAGRLGLPYRPELLGGTGPDARAYQDRITGAATQDAWNFGHGDPALAAKYYFAGPNRAAWGPKTRAYATSVLGRIGG